MIFSIQADLSYTTQHPCDVLLQIEAIEDAAQVCLTKTLTFTPAAKHHAITGEDAIGLRRWVHAEATFDCHYNTRVQVTRPNVQLEQLSSVAFPQTPSDITKYLMPSRYCHPEAFFSFVPEKFGTLSGGARIAAMSNWISDTFTYDISASDAGTTATDSFAKRAGVCRDYAHVLIAMARASGIPARFVSAYGPNVSPQDFHAVVEVYLENEWHLVDPTGMEDAQSLVRIGVGRDAADVSFMTSYGWMELKNQTVSVTQEE